MLGALKAWFVALSTTAKVGVATAALITSGAASAAISPTHPHAATYIPPAATSQVQGAKAVCSGTKSTVTETTPISFGKSSVTDPNTALGKALVQTAGVDGVKTQTYEVVQFHPTGCNSDTKTLVTDLVTTPPVTEVTVVGSYVAPVVTTPPPATATCQNGSYANVDGNTVCDPGTSSNGASAKCVDGTYSYSLHRSGTCSHHGGVAVWY